MTFKRIKSLLSRFGKIERAIEREYTLRRPDWLRLAHLQKIRQMMKKQIFNYTRRELLRGSTRLQPAYAPVRSRPRYH